MSIELESVNEIKTQRADKKKLPVKVVSKIDTTPSDVLKYASEGRDMFFEDGENFVELPTEVYKALPHGIKVRYDMAKRISLGDDVIGTVNDGIRGFSLPFEVRPDSADKQLQVFGKDPRFDYHWARPDKFEKHVREGWVVDHDSNTRTKYDDESCSYKTVGGQKRPELLLLKRPKEVSKQKRVEARAKRNRSVQGAQGDFVRSAESAGVKPLVDESNG